MPIGKPLSYKDFLETISRELEKRSRSTAIPLNAAAQ